MNISLSKNEWDPLKTVIVGIADDARIPWMDPSLRMVNYADKLSVKDIKTGLYPQQVIDEANEDLEIFCTFLRQMGVEVLRPDKSFVPKYYNYCPRDTVLVHDDKILATPSPLRARVGEYKAMEEHLKRFADITVAPNFNTYSMYNTKCIGDPNVLALQDTYPCFDAANILRANDDIFYLLSNSGNNAGYMYLESLMPNKRVHKLQGIYSYMHLDSTLAFLREGLLLANPARIKHIEQLPDILRSWDIIWAPEPFDIGHYPGYCNASKWVSVNLFSVNENLVVVEEHQTELRDLLERKGIACAMLPMRHARTLGGCFHCVTLDLVRSHK